MMDVERDAGGGTGGARRRRERRLRSTMRHERVAVAMVVAEATHHSSRGHKSATVIREEEVHEMYDGPRAQKRPPPGERPGILAEPGRQRSDRTVRRSAGDGLPTPGLPVLAGASGDAIDASTLSFLTATALEDTRKEEEARTEAKKEAKRRKKQDAVDAAVVEFRTLPPERETPETQRRLDELLQFLYPPQSSSSGARRKKRRRGGGKGRGGHVSAAALHDVYVKEAGPAVLSCRRGEVCRAPRVASLNSGLVVACPSFATTDASGR